MSKFTNAVKDLVALASSADAAPAEVQAAAQAVGEAIARAGVAELNAGLTRMAEAIVSVEVSRAAVVASCCGAVVEAGGNPEITLDAVLSRLEETLTRAQLFAEACEEMAADADDRVPDHTDEKDNDAPTDRFGAETAARMPDNADAFNAVEALGKGAIAMLSRSPAGRKRARRARPGLAALAGDLAPYHERAHFLETILSVLDDECLLVLHPAEGKGYRVRLNGVGTNFELFILLADALIGDSAEGWLTGKKPDPDVVAACKERPAETARGKKAEAAFNFHNWRALRPDRKLPSAGDYSSSKDWIWMEGIPADIDQFEGQRLVLLGQPSFVRVLTPSQCFDGMTAELSVDAHLAPREAEQWLQRLSSAPR